MQSIATLVMIYGAPGASKDLVRLDTVAEGQSERRSPLPFPKCSEILKNSNSRS